MLYSMKYRYKICKSLYSIFIHILRSPTVWNCSLHFKIRGKKRERKSLPAKSSVMYVWYIHVMLGHIAHLRVICKMAFKSRAMLSKNIKPENHSNTGHCQKCFLLSLRYYSTIVAVYEPAIIHNNSQNSPQHNFSVKWNKTRNNTL